MSEVKTSAIHAAISAAMTEIARQGIGKESQASLGGATVVRYRGIEAAMNALSGVLIRNKITVTPSYTDLVITERAKEGGKAIRFATLRGAFRFSHVEDGSSVSCECFGEAMDSLDKAVTKAQSVAFRTALFQQFVVPTMAMDPEEGGDDEEAQALSNGMVNDLLAKIKAADSLATLKDAWDESSQAAQSAGDRTALQQFREAKDARKKELLS